MGAARNKTLLLVESECPGAVSRRKELTQHGYEVKYSSSGEDAVLLVKEDDSIDLILLDLEPGEGITGPEAARLILKERRVPIVFMSGTGAEKLVERTQGIIHYGYATRNAGIDVVASVIKDAFRLFGDTAAVNGIS